MNMHRCTLPTFSTPPEASPGLMQPWKPRRRGVVIMNDATRLRKCNDATIGVLHSRENFHADPPCWRKEKPVWRGWFSIQCVLGGWDVRVCGVVANFDQSSRGFFRLEVSFRLEVLFVAYIRDDESEYKNFWRIFNFWFYFVVGLVIGNFRNY